jgi:hypothetical protein
LRATHSATGSVPWVWNDQTGNTNRLPIYAESIHRICHRPAASRASNTHFSGLGPPWRSHPCIEGYPQCHMVRAVGMERSDRQHQPTADTQSRFTVYVTGLLPEPQTRIFRVWGRHGGPILVLRATHSGIGCVLRVWNDQTGHTNRLPIRRVDSPYMSHRPAASRASKTQFSGLGPPWRSHPCIEGYPQCHRGVPWIWNDQTGATNRLPQRRVD